MKSWDGKILQESDYWEEKKSPYRPTTEKAQKLIDLSIFVDQTVDHDCNSQTSNCKSIQRLIRAMVFYQSLTDKESRIEHIYCFVHRHYPSYLDDIIHLDGNRESKLDMVEFSKT